MFCVDHYFVICPYITTVFILYLYTVAGVVMESTISLCLLLAFTCLCINFCCETKCYFEYQVSRTTYNNSNNNDNIIIIIIIYIIVSVIFIIILEVFIEHNDDFNQVQLQANQLG